MIIAAIRPGKSGRSAIIRVMSKHRVVKAVGTSALLGLILLLASALYFWNAQYTLLEGRKGSYAFKLSPYRFRPVTVFEFRSQSGITDRLDRIVFGARTIENVKRVTWLDRDQAVLIDLVATFDSDSTPGPAHLFFDFKRNCLLSTLDGLTTEAEFTHFIAKATAGAP